jgi:hypothetical protein
MPRGFRVWGLGRFRGPVCPDWQQEQLLAFMIDSAERGRPGFKEMLMMTPCDIFPLLRGRTLWLMGDSMMQVRQGLAPSRLCLRCRVHHSLLCGGRQVRQALNTYRS